jgi:hypothetical protein
MSRSPKLSRHRIGKFRIIWKSLLFTASLVYLGTAIQNGRDSKQWVMEEEKEERTKNAPHFQEAEP